MLRFSAIALMALSLAACGDKGADADEAKVDVADETAQVDAEPSRRALKEIGAKAASGAPAGLPADAMRLTPSAIVDWTGFEQPMVAATLFVPYDWTAQGGIVWGNQYMCTNGYAYAWSALAPDQSAGVGVLPQQRWEYNATGQPLKAGCPMGTIDSVEGYLQALLQQVQPDARVLKTYRRNDLERDLAALNTQRDTGFQYEENQVQAGEMIVEYSENGRRMRGLMTAAIVITYMRSGGSQYGAAVEHWVGYALPSYVAFAEADKFDPAFFEGVRRSFTPDPRWEQAISGHNLNISRIEARGAMERAKITSQTYEDIREMSQASWERQQKSADYRAREFSEYIRDVETYDDPQSALGQVELDSGYDHAWRLDDGTYVLTNDHSFNPVAATGQFGEQLGAAP